MRSGAGAFEVANVRMEDALEPDARHHRSSALVGSVSAHDEKNTAELENAEPEWSYGPLSRPDHSRHA